MKASWVNSFANSGKRLMIGALFLVGAQALASQLIIDASVGTGLVKAVSPMALSSGPTLMTPKANSGEALYSVDLPAAGKYSVQYLVGAPNEGANSIFMAFDSAAKSAVWFNVNSAPTWQDSGLSFTLNAGTHLLHIYGREPYTKLTRYRLSLISTSSPAPTPAPVPTPVPTPVATATPAPIPTPSAGTISFKSTFDSGIVSGSALGAWAAEQVVSTDRLQLVTSPSRKGNALRIEVNPGDRPLSGLSTERAEVLVMKSSIDNKVVPENINSGTQYYAFSVMIPTDWKSPTDWGIIFQLHSCDAFGTSPAFAFNVYSPTYYSKVQDEFSIDLNAGYYSGPGQYSNSKHLAFTNGAFNKGQWTDFVIGVTWSTTASGAVNVWRRDVGQTTFTQVLARANIATLTYMPSVAVPASCGTTENPNHYWKTGLYRNASPVTNILYMSGGPTRGTSFDAVVKQAFP